ncbi:hypothetical protein ABVF61_10050 [Roseibium sp. HPY-6]|uniref:hypothetical protein n=1 Tax=Roseibium sp. HPY-6 TaxID=3229852 RepID=UPI00338DAC35
MDEKQNRDLFSETYETLFSLLWLVLAFLVMDYALSILDMQLEDTWYFSLFFAPGGMIFWYFFYFKLLEVRNPHRGLKEFARFAIWVFLLIHLIPVGASELVAILFETASSETQDRGYWWIGYYVSTTFCLYFPYYFFATLFPAMLLGRSDSLRTTLERVFRQTRYLLPRFVGIFFPISFLGASLYVEAQLTGPDFQQLTYSGEPDAFSMLLMLTSGALYVFGEAVFMVISKNAYLRDVQEYGDHPEHDAEVFA